MNRIITAAAIETAVKNCAKMDAQGYTIAQGTQPTLFSVIKPGNRFGDFYTVDKTPGFEYCDCEQFAREGICKHVCFVDNHIEVCEMEAEYDAREDAKYEMIAGKY